MNCPKCGLPQFSGIGGYVGPQCGCWHTGRINFNPYMPPTTEPQPPGCRPLVPVDEAKVRHIVAEEIAKLGHAPEKRLAPNCRREDFDHDLFYEKLDHARRLLDVDWAYIARMTGVGTTTLSRMKDGRKPDAASLAALCAWAGIDIARCIRRRALASATPVDAVGKEKQHGR